MQKSVLIFIVFIALFISDVQSTHALSCLPPDRESAIKNAELIFQGKIIDSDPSQKTNLQKNPSASEIKYIVEVQKIWRGKITSPAIVFGGGIFGYVLSEGETYIFLPSTDEKGLMKLETTCDPTILNTDEGTILLQKILGGKSWIAEQSILLLILISLGLFIGRRRMVRK